MREGADLMDSELIFYARESGRDAFDRMESAIIETDPLEALRSLTDCNKALTAIARELVEEALATGRSKASIARAIDVNPSTFSGWFR